MKSFGLHLWKEWRDNRVVVLGFLVAVPVLLVLAGLALPDGVVSSPVFASVATFAGLGIGVVSLGGDLVPSEARRNTLRFLLRLPGGLGPSFLAKTIFLAASLARMCTDADHRRELGRNAIDRVHEQFTWSKVARAIGALYEDLAAGTVRHVA